MFSTLAERTRRGTRKKEAQNRAEQRAEENTLN